jgi:cytochrome P450
MMMMSLRTEVLKQPVALGVSLLVICITIYGVQWAMRRKQFIDACNRLPGPPISGYSPWLCHVQPFVESLDTVPGYPGIPRSFSAFCKYYQDSGKEGIFRLWIFNPYHVPFARCIVSLWDPHLVRQFLTDQSITRKIIRERKATMVVRPLLGDSFLMLPDGAKWKHQRKLAARGFNQEFLEYTNKVVLQLLYEKVFVSLDQKLELAAQSNINKDDAVATLEMLEWCTRITSEVLGLVAFSYSFGGLDEGAESGKEDSIFGIYNTLLSILTRRMRALPIVSYFRWRENRVFDAKLSQLDAIVDKVILERLAEHERKCSAAKTNSTSSVDKKERDLLSYMLQEDEEGGERLSYIELRDNTKLFMFAGQDTTANALTFALWELATHAEAQDKLRAEVDSLFDSLQKGQHPDYKDIMGLKYLDAVFKETLRMYSPGLVIRTAAEDVTLTNKGGQTYTIPKDTSVYVLPPIIQRQDRLYPDRPNEWVPDRFLDGNGGSTQNNSWLPFSVGPRNCVGQPLATAELKILLAHMVRHYVFRRSEKMDVDPILMLLITLKPHQALLEISRRPAKR